MGIEQRRPAVHAMCGLVCSGKTTVAKLLADELSAIRLTRDEWMLRLYGLPYDHPNYAAKVASCTDAMWSHALRSLSAGRSVVLDWNHWNPTRRAESRQRAAAAGARFVLHHVDVPIDVAVAQAAIRNSEERPDVHRIDESAVRHFATIFEPPNSVEGLEIVRHRATPGREA